MDRKHELARDGLFRTLHGYSRDGGEASYASHASPFFDAYYGMDGHDAPLADEAKAPWVVVADVAEAALQASSHQHKRHHHSSHHQSSKSSSSAQALTTSGLLAQGLANAAEWWHEALSDPTLSLPVYGHEATLPPALMRPSQLPSVHHPSALGLMVRVGADGAPTREAIEMAVAVAHESGRLGGFFGSALVAPLVTSPSSSQSMSGGIESHDRGVALLVRPAPLASPSSTDAHKQIIAVFGIDHLSREPTRSHGELALAVIDGSFSPKLSATSSAAQPTTSQSAAALARIAAMQGVAYSEIDYDPFAMTLYPMLRESMAMAGVQHDSALEHVQDSHRRYGSDIHADADLSSRRSCGKDGPLYHDPRAALRLASEQAIARALHARVTTLPSGAVSSVIGLAQAGMLCGAKATALRSTLERSPDLTLWALLQTRAELTQVVRDVGLNLSTAATAFTYFERLGTYCLAVLMSSGNSSFISCCTLAFSLILLLRLLPVRRNLVSSPNRALAAATCLVLAIKWIEGALFRSRVAREHRAQVSPEPPHRIVLLSYHPTSQPILVPVSGRRPQRLFESARRVFGVTQAAILKCELGIFASLGLRMDAEPGHVLPHLDQVRTGCAMLRSDCPAIFLTYPLLSSASLLHNSSLPAPGRALFRQRPCAALL